MALTSTEEAMVRDLIAQNAAILSLAGNEANITAKLAAEQVTLSDLSAASGSDTSDLMLVRQGTSDKSITRAVLRAGLLAGTPLKALDDLTPAANRLPYFTSSSAADLAVLTAFARTILDDADAATVRTTIDVFSKAEAREMTPPGTLGLFFMNTAPTGWLKANGDAVSRSTYADLFAKIGTFWGAGDGSSTFNLPDVRGEFFRAWDDGRGVDSGRAFGSAQGGQNATHTHGVNDPGHTHGGGNLVGTLTAGSGANGLEEGQQAPNYTRESITASPTGISIQSSGGTEARPRNIAILACIKT